MVFVHRVKRRKMTDFIHLTGAEDVYRAGTIIMGAAETMKQAAALIDDTNDLNPNTKAEYHLDVLEFLKMLQDRDDIPKADLAIFDPPYSPEQLKRTYKSCGIRMREESAHRTANWAAERNILDKLVSLGGYVLSFGWSSNGMGKKRGYNIEEILMVCHGGGHYDTICTAEKKVSEQLNLFK